MFVLLEKVKPGHSIMVVTGGRGWKEDNGEERWLRIANGHRPEGAPPPPLATSAPVGAEPVPLPILQASVLAYRKLDAFVSLSVHGLQEFAPDERPARRRFPMHIIPR